MLVNPFVPNALFLYPLKTLENLREKVHWEQISLILFLLYFIISLFNIYTIKFESPLKFAKRGAWQDLNF